MNLFSLQGRTALVTGASRGLGAAIALGLAEAGARVAVHGNTRSPEDTAERIRGLGQEALCLVGDLADPTTPERLLQEARAGLGALDILINNAGTIRRGPAALTSDQDWLAVLEVNLTGVFRMCRAAGGVMLAAGAGKIVNIASLLSFQGGLTVPAYAAAKGGVAQLTKALAKGEPAPSPADAAQGAVEAELVTMSTGGDLP